MTGLTITTRFGNDIIEQIDSLEKFPGRPEEIARRIMNLQDAGVRQALIALGWTPPADDSSDVVQQAATKLGASKASLPGLWNAPGYPELTTGQMLDIASRL